jgi:hypothetical protein
LTLLVGGIWLAVLVVAGILVVGVTSQGEAAQALPSVTLPSLQSFTDTPLPTQAETNTPGPPTDTPLPPTITPTFTVTPTATITPTATPLPFQEGPIAIGISVQGRPVEVYRFGTGRYAYVVVAGIHGGYEANTVKLADQLIAFFSDHHDLIPFDTTLYILRVLNPDGFVRPNQYEGRANANGVDLNRNYPLEWARDWNKFGCWDFLPIYGGEYPASEPETVAMMAFIIEHPAIALISYHSAAPGFYPSGDPPHADSVDLARHLEAASGYPYPGVNLGCQMTGTLVDWVHSYGTAALDVELSTHWDTEFETNLKLVRALMAWRP